MNYNEYKSWLGDRSDTMSARSEYNKAIDGPIATSGGLVGASSGKAADADGGYGGYRDEYGAALEAQSRLARQKLEAQISLAIQKINAGKTAVQEDYEQGARSAYINKKLAERTLEQQTRAMGYSGGMSETARAALESDYTGALSDLGQARNQAIYELENTANQVRAQGDISLAELESSSAEKLALYARELSEKKSTATSYPEPISPTGTGYAGVQAKKTAVGAAGAAGGAGTPTQKDLYEDARKNLTLIYSGGKGNPEEYVKSWKSVLGGDYYTKLFDYYLSVERYRH